MVSEGYAVNERGLWKVILTVGIIGCVSLAVRQSFTSGIRWSSLALAAIVFIGVPILGYMTSKRRQL